MVDFESWKAWTGNEMATFICTFCSLPEYQEVIRQNLTGQAIEQLMAAKMLSKGLARAGICDKDHQDSISVALSSLIELPPEELASKHEEMVVQVQAAAAAPRTITSVPHRADNRPRIVSPAGMVFPRATTPTEKMLQESHTDHEHDSEDRRSVAPEQRPPPGPPTPGGCGPRSRWLLEALGEDVVEAVIEAPAPEPNAASDPMPEKAPPASSSPEPAAAPQVPAAAPASPTEGVVVAGVRGVQKLQQQASKTAEDLTTASHRYAARLLVRCASIKDTGDVNLLQRDGELHAAATKIQAAHRGKQERAAVQKQKAEETAAATRIQALHRGKQDRAAVAARRAEVG
mmetsp:Transcript_31349/g.91461  ORF Transcript_31349/g.91461 Transcript_31349/m.91461 type:complete len:345 (-) Transcript_31349:163-1197(-)